MTSSDLRTRSMTSRELHGERDKLESSIDRLRILDLTFLLIVVIGLFMELREPVTEFLATGDCRALDRTLPGALVAIGVAGEFLAEFLARRKENRLRMVNEIDLKQSDERIAENERQAEEARLETEKLKERFAWRQLTEDQQKTLLARLSHRTGSIWIEHLEGDLDSWNLANLFLQIFSEAQWEVGSLSWIGGRNLIFGVCLFPPIGLAKGDMFWFVEESLKNAGITPGSSNSEYMMPNGTSSISIPMPSPQRGPALRLFIGPKQQSTQ
jgi:hypothetical protein